MEGRSQSYGVLSRDKDCSNQGRIPEEEQPSKGALPDGLSHSLVYVCFCLGECMSCVSTHSESRRGCWIPWCWSYRQSSTAWQRLGTDKDWEWGRARGDLNGWAVASVPMSKIYRERERSQAGTKDTHWINRNKTKHKYTKCKSKFYPIRYCITCKPTKNISSENRIAFSLSDFWTGLECQPPRIVTQNSWKAGPSRACDWRCAELLGWLGDSWGLSATGRRQKGMSLATG